MAWTKRTLPSPKYPYGLWPSGTGRWLMGDSENSEELYLTSDWSTFTTFNAFSSLSINVQPVDAVFNGTSWYALLGGSAGVIRSTDGETGAAWEQVTWTSTPAMGAWAITVTGTGRMLVLSRQGLTTTLFSSDDDGANWVARLTLGTTEVDTPYAGFSYGSGGNIYVYSGDAYYYSVDDGGTWTALTSAGFAAGKSAGVIEVDGKLIACGYDKAGAMGRPVVSLDAGATWVDLDTLGTTPTFSTGSAYYAALTDGGQALMLEATGTELKVWQSADLVTWTELDSTGILASEQLDPYPTLLKVQGDTVAFANSNWASTSTLRAVWTSPYAALVTPVEIVDDGVLATDEYDPHGGLDLSDEALATDELTGVNARYVDEAATAVDDLIPAAVATVTVGETSTASDLASQVAGLTVDETSSASDLFESNLLFLIDETSAASDDLTLFATGGVITAETSTASDEYTPVNPAIVDDAVTASDAVFATAAVSVLEEITAGDILTVGGATDEIVDELATSSDEYTNVVTTSALIDEVMAASDAYPFVRNDLIAWVMNTETGAPSWYANWAFTDMVQVGTRVIAIGPGGVAVLGGNTDDGSRIPARLKYGYTEFGRYDNDGNPMPDDSRKRVDGVYVGYKSSGVLNLTCKVHGYSEYRYTMPKREAASQPRDNRIQPGKGLVGRYWQLGVENTAGAAFEVTSIAADVATSTRRI